MQFNSIQEAANEIKNGKFVVICDHKERENEGDLVIAAEFMTEEKMAFMVKHTSGLVCVPLMPERCEELGLKRMVPLNEHTEPHGTCFMTSVDAIGTGSGISARDRALTARMLSGKSLDFVKPGHMFPLQYGGGVLKRPGHTEASIDLCSIAGVTKAAVICEIVDDTGDMARGSKLQDFVNLHKLKVISVEQLINHLKV